MDHMSLQRFTPLVPLHTNKTQIGQKQEAKIVACILPLHHFSHACFPHNYCISLPKITNAAPITSSATPSHPDLCREMQFCRHEPPLLRRSLPTVENTTAPRWITFKKRTTLTHWPTPKSFNHNQMTRTPLLSCWGKKLECKAATLCISYKDALQIEYSNSDCTTFKIIRDMLAVLHPET